MSLRLTEEEVDSFWREVQGGQIHSGYKAPLMNLRFARRIESAVLRKVADYMESRLNSSVMRGVDTGDIWRREATHMWIEMLRSAAEGK